MQIEMLLVTFKRDFPYLRYWLRGLEKNVRGFQGCNILVPTEDLAELREMVAQSSGESGIPINCLSGDEWAGKGFNWHQAQHLRADVWCPNADVIVHTDPDRPFIASFTPEDVVRDGKPLLVHGSYRWLREEVQANLDMWREGVWRAIGVMPTEETMRRMPIPHIRETHLASRAMMETHTQMHFEDYMLAQRNEFPQTIAEFNVLGAVAWEKFKDRYHWLDQEKGEYPPDKVVNGWSQQGLRAEDEAKFKEAGLA